MTSTRPETQVRLDNLSVTFRSGGVIGPSRTVALKNITLTIPAGQTLGLVGESGSGKTTLGRVLVGLLQPSSGTFDIHEGRSKKQGRGYRQLVGQNPRWALNPRLRIWRSIAEPLAIANSPRSARRDTALQMLHAVNLPAELADRYPHQLSGGQLQRAAIARALVSEPGLIVFDEAVSALDVSVQVQTINLIKDVQARLGFTALFISHDLASVRYAAHRVAVLYHGVLMHEAPSEAFYERPLHPYSLALQSADRVDHTIALRDNSQQSPGLGLAERGGCPLAPRCPFVVARCHEETPLLREVAQQLTACHRAEELATSANPTELITPTQAPTAEPRPGSGTKP